MGSEIQKIHKFHICDDLNLVHDIYIYIYIVNKIQIITYMEFVNFLNFATHSFKDRLLEIRGTVHVF